MKALHTLLPLAILPTLILTEINQLQAAEFSFDRARWNNGSDILSYSFSESCSWISVNPISGNSSGEHDLIFAYINIFSFTKDEKLKGFGIFLFFALTTILIVGATNDFSGGRYLLFYIILSGISATKKIQIKST